MERVKIPVTIKLTTEINDLGKRDVTVVEEQGTFQKRGNTSVLTFTERHEDQEHVDALITINPNKISVKRSGAVNMLQIFKKKQKTENVYRHAYGTIHMETHTDQITYEESTDNRRKGKLFISYTTKLNGEGQRRHRLTLTFKEEKEQ